MHQSWLLGQGDASLMMAVSPPRYLNPPPGSCQETQQSVETSDSRQR